jgi:hypothetical protein
MAYPCVILEEYPHRDDGIMKGTARFQVKRASFLESKGGRELQSSKYWVGWLDCSLFINPCSLRVFP